MSVLRQWCYRVTRNTEICHHAAQCRRDDDPETFARRGHVLSPRVWKSYYTRHGYIIMIILVALRWHVSYWIKTCLWTDLVKNLRLVCPHCFLKEFLCVYKMKTCDQKLIFHVTRLSMSSVSVYFDKLDFVPTFATWGTWQVLHIPQTVWRLKFYKITSDTSFSLLYSCLHG